MRLARLVNELAAVNVCAFDAHHDYPSCGAGAIGVERTSARRDPRRQPHAARHRPWRYFVEATDARGHPLSGSVTIEFVVASWATTPRRPTRSPPGAGAPTAASPAAAVGAPLAVRAIVRTHPAAITLDWAITVRR